MANGSDPQAFFYHRSVAPMMWAMVALMAIEIVVVHGLLAWWNWRVAVAVSAVSLGGIGWLVAVIRSMRHRPVLLGADALVWRVGMLRSIAVPLDEVAGLRPAWDGTFVKARSTLNLGLIAYPNVVVDLRRPLPGKRGIAAFAHRLDDPAAFAAALERLGERA